MEKLIPITMVNEIDREKPYTAETFRQVGLKKLTHLTAIKELMESDGYEQKRRAFETESERLSEEISRHTAHIDEWKQKMTEKIMGDTTLSDEQKQRKMQNAVYGKMEEMYRQVESGYLEDYKKAMAEDERAKKLSALQLDYLFSECDTVCFHAEEDLSLGDECDERFAQILDDVVKTEKTENYGMNVLRIYLKPTQKLKDYLLSFKRFDRYHFDAYQRYDPYLSFADILFLKNGEALLSCLTHEGYFDVAEGIKPVFDGFEK